MESKGMIGLAAKLLEIVELRSAWSEMSLLAIEARVRLNVVRSTMQHDDDDEEDRARLAEVVAEHQVVVSVKALLPEVQHGNSVLWCVQELLRRSYSLMS